MSLHSFETEDLEMPFMPMARITSSTRLLLMPAIWAFWMTDTSVFSAVL